MAKRIVSTKLIEEIRHKVTVSINQKLRSWEIPQEKIAQRLGNSRERVNRIMLEKTQKISLEALISYAEAAGLSVEISIK